MKNLSGKDMVSKNIKKKQRFQTFQDTILNLQKFWQFQTIELTPEYT